MSDIRTPILVLGLPGSGKSTLAASLAKELHAVHFKASEVLRQYIRDSEDFVHWREAWAQGRSAPDDEVLPVLWAQYIAASGRTVLDGYPRTLRQLRDFLARGGSLGAALHLRVPVHVALDRITSRAEAGRVDDTTAVARSRVRHEQDALRDLLRTPEMMRVLGEIDATIDPDRVLAASRDFLAATSRGGSA